MRIEKFYFISRNWVRDDFEKDPFELADQDKQTIREYILPAITASPEPIRVQLCAVIGIILRHDFPEKWPQIMNKIGELLHSMDGPSWLGALLVLRRLVKLYE